MRARLFFLMTAFFMIGNAEAGIIDSLETRFREKPTAKNLEALLKIPYDALVADLARTEKLTDSLVVWSKKFKNAVFLGDAYQMKALNAYYQGRYELAVEAHLASIESFREAGDSSRIGGVFLNMGYQVKRRDLKLAIEQMETGIRILQSQGDSERLVGGYDNLGVLYEMKKDFKSARWFYQRSLDMKRERNDSIGLPYSLNHLAGLAALQGNFDEANRLFEQGYLIRKIRGDLNGMAESRMMQAEMLTISKEFSKVPELLDETIMLGKRIGYLHLVKTALKLNAEAYAELGAFEKAFRLHQEYALLDDSLYNLASNNRIMELEKRFQVAEKERDNERLRQEAQVSALELEAERQSRLQLLWGAVSAILSLILLFGFVYSRQQLRQRAEKEALQRTSFQAVIKAEEKERSRIARELHDGVGQLLAAIKLHTSVFEVQLSPPFSEKVKEQIQMIDEAVQEVRHISHNLMPVALMNKGLMAALRTLADRLEGKLQFELYIDDETRRFDAQTEMSIYRMVQEVTGNMLKHAEASRIVVDIQGDGTDLLISIRDNGKGFDLALVEKSSGIGWENLKTRTNLMGGTMEIQSAPGKGTSVLFVLPVLEGLAVAS